MDLATPAPKVGKAAAAEAPVTEAADSEHAVPSAAPKVEAAQAVGRAETVDDPRKHAPAQEAELPSLLSPKTLRGTTGADFESNAAVLRGAPKKNILKKVLPFIYDERDFVAYGEVLRYVLIKGDMCFVFAEDTDPSPIYSIPLRDVKPIMEDPRRPDKASVTISPTANSNMSKSDMKTILLKYRNGEQAFQFTFDTHTVKDVAQRFFDTVEKFSFKGAGSIPTVTASVAHAKAVGKDAAKAQPKI